MNFFKNLADLVGRDVVLGLESSEAITLILSSLLSNTMISLLSLFN